jgi:hypothetical protein
MLRIYYELFITDLIYSLSAQKFLISMVWMYITFLIKFYQHLKVYL